MVHNRLNHGLVHLGRVAERGDFLLPPPAHEYITIGKYGKMDLAVRTYSVCRMVAMESNVILDGKNSSVQGETRGADLETSLAEIPIAKEFGIAGIAPEDFDSIVRRNQRRIFAVLLLYLRDSDAADALTQECFLRAFESRARFRGECTLETWLMRIAVNLARDYMKSRRRNFWARLVRSEKALARCRVADAHLSPEGVLLAREEVAALWSGIEELSHRQKSVFLLRFAEEMTLEEIAAVLELEPGTVKSHLARALGALRRRLQGEAHETPRR
jgi:RNA polymerase sigma-70 factor (ECF subfamily)